MSEQQHRPANGKDEYPDLGDDEEEEEKTDVTKLQDALDAKIEASCKKMDGVARKAARLSSDLKRRSDSYPKMRAVLSDRPPPSKAKDTT